MILHTCSHCKSSALYSVGIGQQVNCRSCGAAFNLSRFTRTEKSTLLKAYELAQLKARNLRTSKWLLLTSGGVGVIFLTWLALSVFGVIPDEARLVNRRFVSTSVIEHLDRTVGLIAVGGVNDLGEIAFTEFFTAATISTDGFMLTSRHAAQASFKSRLWVLLDGKRYDARVIAADSLGDFALIKIDGEVPLKFKISRIEKLTRLNQEVMAVGRQGLAEKIDSPVDWPLSVTRGTISRVLVDKLGTEWIEHSAPIGRGGSIGGPLLLADTIIGINIESDAGISRAISVLPHRQRIYRAIDEWTEEKANKQ